MNSISQNNDENHSLLSVTDFFSVLYDGVDHGHITISNYDSNGKLRSFHVPIQELHTIEPKVKLLTEKSNVYFGVGLRKPNLNVSQRGAKNDITALTSLFLEIDILGGAHEKLHLPNFNEAKTVLNSFNLEPSIVNSSGGGLHVFYLLDEPIYLESQEDRQQAGKLLKRLENVIHALLKHKGKVADSVAELSRVLRPPGTLNHKYDPPREVKTIHFKENRYSQEEVLEAIEEFEDRLNIQQDDTQPQQAEQTVTMDDQALMKIIRKSRQGDKFKKLFDDGDISDYESDSEADSGLACMLAWWTKNSTQIERIMRESSLYREKWDTHKTYLNEFTIQNALKTVKGGYKVVSNGDFKLNIATDNEKHSTVPDIIVNEQGNTKKILANLKEMLLFEDMMDGIGFNEFTQEVTTHGEPIDDSFISKLRYSIDSKYYITFNPADVLAIVEIIARERNSYHPIKQIVERKPWDKVKRAETIFIDYLGAEDNSYTRSVARKWLAGAIARVYEPGIKMEIVPVLQGKQGIGKSTLASKLGGDYFVDTLSSLGNTKDDYQLLIGSFIVELGELTGMSNTGVDKVKSFISARFDKIRLPYTTMPKKYYRTCVFIGTTNEGQFLNDPTGSRRFFPIELNQKAPQDVFKLDETTVQQIWAEAYHTYKQGEKLYLDNELDLALAEKYREKASEESLFLMNIQEYLDMKVPKDWDNLQVSEKRTYFENYQNNGMATGTQTMTKTTTKEIANVLDLDSKDRNSKPLMKMINNFMNHNDEWERKPIKLKGKTVKGFMRLP
jgi:predicted P-loop ATPase